MTAVQALRSSADLAFQGLLTSIADLTEQQSWATASLLEGEYLHSNGSIIGLVQHVAVCKVTYASCAFHDNEIRGRDAHAQLVSIGPDWAKTLDYLHESQRYWLTSWENLEDSELDVERMRFSGKAWPTWKLIATVNGHDEYHAGQIALVRASFPPCDTPRAMGYDIDEKYMRMEPTW